MNLRVALALQDSVNLRQSVEHARYAESRGFESIWQAERLPDCDSLAVLGAYAAVTTQIKLGSAVIAPWSRDPAVLAATLITLDDLAPDRLQFGIGIGMESSVSGGDRHERPLLALRETISAVREYLARPAQGTIGRKTRRLPIYLGATGFKTCALAGEIADGVLLNYLVSPMYTSRMVEAIERGAQVSGRNIEAIDRPQMILTSIDFDRRRAFDRIRPLITQYLAAYPGLMRACGLPPDLLDEIAQVLSPLKRITDRSARTEAIDRASAIVPDEVIGQLAAVGTPSEVRAGVDQYIAAGCTCPIVAAPGGDLKVLIDSFAVR